MVSRGGKTAPTPLFRISNPETACQIREGKVAGNAEEGGMDTVQPADADPFGFTKDRRLSMSTIDTLPAYDDHKSPAYTETFDGQAQEQVRADVGLVSPGPVAWQSRLMMSTSGLSIAMSDESLRRLKYCLRLLRWANEHIAKVISALQAALDQLERPRRDRAAGSSPADEKRDADTGSQADDTSEPEPDRGAIAARISALKGDVVKTLINAIQTVSKYAGGALPENARDLVRRHLTSLPDPLPAGHASYAGSGGPRPVPVEQGHRGRSGGSSYWRRRAWRCWPK